MAAAAERPPLIGPWPGAWQQGICEDCRRVRVKRKGGEKDGCDCHTPKRAEPQSLRLEAASQPGRHLSVGNRTSDQVQRRLARPPQAALYNCSLSLPAPPIRLAWSRLHLLSLPVCWGETLPVAHLRSHPLPSNSPQFSLYIRALSPGWKPHGPWAHSWSEKVWISYRRHPRGERGSGAERRWLSSPNPASADARVSGEPRQVPREPGARRVWESGPAAGRGAEEGGRRGSLACPFAGRGPERRAGDVAAADLPGAQCPF
ncbi:uncharacterized protein LOC130706540 [Balaenoptera acutorostrata]|uniref:Uncharacterized protein LOC130706540 n=1 Tax=Balaenoptera acutorostrata TaxID=9767 RepID=A0ABM3SZ31_BALAC|nr:uncharacterized protein LOC130706540 [Balaenoptera acutorostrata]